jgi:hypothetical protein
MGKKQQKPSAPGRKKSQQPQAPLLLPVDVVDGIPDRSASRPRWKLALLAMVFVAWLALLIWVALSGGRNS